MNIILGNLLETFEIFTKKNAAESKTPYFVAAERSGWAGCIVTPGWSLVHMTLFLGGKSQVEFLKHI